MATHNLKRKVRTYRSLYLLNRSFETVARNCRLIEKLGLMPIGKMRVYHDLARELQAQISGTVVDHMFGVEDEDAFHFGKTRSNWEHHLNPDRRAFQKLERS